MENYEQKYKDALSWMKDLYPTFEGATKEDAEHYFPELKESEEERIRKAIKLLIEMKESDSIGLEPIYGASYKEMIAWHKDALVAEIERFKTDALQKKSQCKRSGLERIMHQIGAYNKVISLINTLEVKEVDLKKEFSQWWKGERAKDYNVDILYERYPNVSMKLAKHFFELCLKAQKGE